VKLVSTGVAPEREQAYNDPEAEGEADRVE
jgi:hypothetical protein